MIGLLRRWIRKLKIHIIPNIQYGVGLNVIMEFAPLIRRILQGKGLYRINNVVDTNNLISIETGYSVGSYDLENLHGNINFRIGNIGEKYQGIGKEMINIENLPVFADDFGAYGSPTSDSTRAMITEKSKDILTVLISFNGIEGLEKSIDIAKKYLTKYAGAEDIQSIIV